MTQYCVLFAVQQFLQRQLGHTPRTLTKGVSTGVKAFLNASMEVFFLTWSLHICVVFISAKVHNTHV